MLKRGSILFECFQKSRERLSIYSLTVSFRTDNNIAAILWSGSDTKDLSRVYLELTPEGISRAAGDAIEGLGCCRALPRMPLNRTIADYAAYGLNFWTK